MAGHPAAVRKVSGNATLPAYVFVKVDDETDDLVTYEIADGWTQLADAEGVYWREVPKGEFGPFSVLKGDKVSYSEDITNEDMGNLEDEASLTFTAYAIQKAPFADAMAAWAEIENAQQSDTPAPELPEAELEDLDVSQIPSVTDEDTGWTGDLDLAVNFSTPDEPADLEGKDYKDWKVDFLLSFNKAIPDGSKVHLFGNYGTYGWRGDDLAAGGIASLAEGQELAVMSDWFLPAIGQGNGKITYEEVVNMVQSFDCGVAVEDDDLANGLVATLKLVMIDGNGAQHVIDTSTHNF